MRAWPCGNRRWCMHALPSVRALTRGPVARASRFHKCCLVSAVCPAEDLGAATEDETSVGISWSNRYK